MQRHARTPSRRTLQSGSPIFASFLLILAVLGIWGSPAQAREPVFRTVQVDDLPVHEEPRPGSPVLSSFRRGQRVMVANAAASGWLRVRVKGIKGYVEQRFLGPADSPAARRRATTPAASTAKTEGRKTACGGSGTTVWWILGILTVLTILGRLVGPGSCQICGNSIRRTSYVWTLGGKSRTVCPECNTTLRKRNSRASLP